MWLFLVVLGAVQLYAVRELLAVFAIFVLGFGVIAVGVGSTIFTVTSTAMARSLRRCGIGVAAGGAPMRAASCPVGTQSSR